MAAGPVCRLPPDGHLSGAPGIDGNGAGGVSQGREPTVLRRSALTALLATTVLAACEDGPGAPREPFFVAIQVTRQYAPEYLLLAQGPIVECGVDLEAVVRGRSSVRWEGATIRWFAGITRTTVLDSLRIPGWQARAAWTAETLSAARNETTSWDISARAPFDAEMSFRYRVVGSDSVGSATTRFSCGPVPPAGGVAPPRVRVTGITTQPELEPGDLLTVTYDVESDFGLWTSHVSAADAFTLTRSFAHELAVSATRTAAFEVPPGGVLGQPLRVRVRAVDAALQETVVDVPTTMVIVDRRPPVIVSHGPVTGDYLVGQTFSISARATDNNQLAWLVYEFGAPVSRLDSVRVAADVQASDWNIPLVVQPGWVGTPTFRFFVRDAAGNASAPVEAPAGGLRFLAAP